jgi:hypothetical protein
MSKEDPVLFAVVGMGYLQHTQHATEKGKIREREMEVAILTVLADGGMGVGG